MIWIVFPLQLLGGLLINAALAVIAYLFFLFRVHGEGTPVPTQPTKKVISVGLYRYTRNPMYWCHLVIILGEFLISFVMAGNKSGGNLVGRAGFEKTLG